MRLHCVALAGGLLLSVVPPVSAGRPFATEDAGVLEVRACELESFVSRQTARGAAHETGASFQGACGVGLNTQLGLGLARSKAAGESSSAVQLAGKSFVQEQTDDQAGFTLAYQFAASKTPGGRFQRESSNLGAVASVPWRSALLHANLGWSRSFPSRQDSTTWAVAFEQPGTGGVDVGVEAFGDDRSAAWLGLGLRWAPVENVFVDASFATQADSARARVVTLGMKFGF